MSALQSPQQTVDALDPMEFPLWTLNKDPKDQDWEWKWQKSEEGKKKGVVSQLCSTVSSLVS